MQITEHIDIYRKTNIMANRHLAFLRSNDLSYTKAEAINKLKNIFNNPALSMKDGEGAIERYYEYFQFDNTKGKFVIKPYDGLIQEWVVVETIPEPFMPGHIYTSGALVIVQQTVSNETSYVVKKCPSGTPTSYDNTDGWSTYTFNLAAKYTTIRSVLGICTKYSYNTGNDDPNPTEEIAMTVIDNEDSINELSDAIESMDFTDTAVAANVITKIVRDNGTVTITRAELKGVDGVTVSQTAGSGETFDGSQDVKIGIKVDSTDRVLTTDTTNGIKTNLTLHKLTQAEIDLLSDGSNIREAYKIRGKDDGNNNPQYIQTDEISPSDGIIKVYKDSSLYDVYLGNTNDILIQYTWKDENNNVLNTESKTPSVNDLTYYNDNGVYKVNDYKVTSYDSEHDTIEVNSIKYRYFNITPAVYKETSGDDALCFIYNLSSGVYQLTPVNIESYLQENEFKDGLTVSGHEVSVKVDNKSIEFGSESGVNKSIKTKVSTASGNIISIMEVPSSTTNATIADGSTTFSATWLTGITQTSGTPDSTVYKITTSGDYLNKYYKWNGSKYTEVATGLYASSDNIEITDYSAPTYNTDGSSIDQIIDANVVSDGNSVSSAINKVDNKLAAVTNAIIDSELVITNTFAKVKNAMGASGADDDTNPGINNRFEYIADTNTNYIKEASSLFDADKKLDAAIKSNADAIDSNTQDIINLRKSDRYYGVSNEAAGVAAKTVTGTNLGEFVYTNGERIVVTFNNANTASNATLNVNNLGARPIYYNGSPIAAGVIEAGSSHLFVYEGTNGGRFILTGDLSDTSIEYLKDIQQGNGISITDSTVNATITSESNVAPFSATWLTGIDKTSVSTADGIIYKITTAGSYYGQYYTWNGSVYERTGLTKTVATRLSTGQVTESGGNVTVDSPSNLLMYDATGALSILDTWDCGTYEYI